MPQCSSASRGACKWWRGQRGRCGVSGSRMDVDGSLRMRCRKEIPSCFLITCVRAAATGGDKGADLGPLYLCSVTDVRRSSLHSVLRPGSAWQQISAGCSPRHPTEGGCVARARRRQVLIVAVLDRPSTHKADVSHRRECGRKAGLMRSSSCRALGTLHYPKPHER